MDHHPGVPTTSFRDPARLPKHIGSVRVHLQSLMHAGDAAAFWSIDQNRPKNSHPRRHTEDLETQIKRNRPHAHHEYGEAIQYSDQ
jgi:hypothetical protein